jgi:hypothetical protein
MGLALCVRVRACVRRVRVCARLCLRVGGHVRAACALKSLLCVGVSGDRYVFRVRAVNAEGHSLWTDTSAPLCLISGRALMRGSSDRSGAGRMHVFPPRASTTQSRYKLGVR